MVLLDLLLYLYIRRNESHVTTAPHFVYLYDKVLHYHIT